MYSKGTTRREKYSLQYVKLQVAVVTETRIIKTFMAKESILNVTKDQSNLEESKSRSKGKQYALKEISKTAKDHNAIKHKVCSLESTENKMLWFIIGFVFWLAMAFTTFPLPFSNKNENKMILNTKSNTK